MCFTPRRVLGFCLRCGYITALCEIQPIQILTCILKVSKFTCLYDLTPTNVHLSQLYSIIVN